jgi:Ca2+-binding RTX toxin-like protein
MGSFTFEITASATYVTDAPSFNLYVDGILVSTDAITAGFGSLNTFIYTLNFSGNAPSSLYFQFDDASSETGRRIIVQSLKVNSQVINTDQITFPDGGVLNGNSKPTLDVNETLNIDVASSEYLFGIVEPTLDQLGFNDPTIMNDPVITTANSADNHLLGQDGINDLIQGKNGDDIIAGQSGDDILYGNAGNDIILGGDGNDILGGYEDNDLLFGGDGNDIVRGHDGNDILNGGLGDDKLYGGTGNDTIYGGAGIDIIYGDEGNDTIDGGAGNDRIYGGLDVDTLSGGLGIDLIMGEEGDDIINGDDGNDALYGGDGNDTVNGGNGNDRITGDLGTDTLIGGAGNDRINGGDDNDIINGDDGNDILYGDAGDDTIDGGIGVDVIYGDEGNDTIDGGAGNDRIYGGLDVDTLSGGLGIDLIMGEEGDDIINGDDGNDALYGGDGNDTVNGGNGNDRITGDLGTDTLIGGAGNDRINGGDDNDIINGDDGNDILYGDAGDDTIDGGIGVDVIYGGTGADTIHGDEGDDILVGNDGADTLYGGIGDDRIYGLNDNDTIYGDAGADYLVGHDGDDTIYGGDDDDRLYGQAGNDTLYGGAGNDFLFGREGFDSLYGEGGDDILVIVADDVVVDGGAGTDTLGVAGNDTITINFGSGVITGIDVIDMVNMNDLIAANNLQISAADIVAYTDTNAVTIRGDVGLDQVNFSFSGSEVRNADVTIDSIDYAHFTDGVAEVYIQLGLVLNGSFLLDFGGGGGGGPTNGDDLLIGTPNQDTISALDGNDIIVGDADDDILNGDGGNDKIYGGEGDDELNGGDGDDIIYASLTGDTEVINPNDIEAANPGVFYSAATGNYYQFVLGAFRQGEASTAAQSALINGVSGHLLTITSQAENDFIEGLVGSNFAWMDGSDLDSEGTFLWTEGPETGLQFWTDIGNYENWYGGSPTTNSGERDNVLFLGSDYNGEWYAWTQNYDSNYVVEWEGTDISQQITVGYDSSGESNILNGGAGSDTMYGSMGSDILNGGAGSDVMVGGAGDDIIHSHGLSRVEIDAILTANPNVVYSEETGSFYQLVTGSVSWAAASAAAQSALINGVGGHLVVITTQFEDDFVYALQGSRSIWMGGSDAGSEGVWQWVTGVENGMQFWNGGQAGTAIGDQYVNWHSSQPNDTNSTQDYLYKWNGNGQWADLAGGSSGTVNGYVIEWDGSSFVDDGATDTLNGGFGADELYGSDGQDIFVFEADSAFTDVDNIHNFSNADNDIIDLSDILDGISIDATNITDYVSVDALTGVRVDLTGSASFDTLTQIAGFRGYVGTDDALTMFNNGDLLV